MRRPMTAMALALTLGCPPPSQPEPPVDPARAQPERPVDPVNPMSAQAGATVSVETLQVRILELLPAGGYLYMRVAEAAGRERWVAVNKRAVVVGQQVEIITLATREGFYSKRLGRHFERLTFGVLG